MSGIIGVSPDMRSGVVGAWPSGHVLQVVQSDLTGTDSVASGTWSDIDGTDNNGSGSIFCCKITPQFTSSKIVIGGTVNIGQQAGNNSAVVRFLRDSTVLAVPKCSSFTSRIFMPDSLETNVAPTDSARSSKIPLLSSP